MSTPNHTLQTLAADLSEWADINELTIASLCKQNPGLGGLDTFKSALADTLSPQEAAALRAPYEAVCNLLSSGTAEDDADPLYDDLEQTKGFRLQFTRLKLSKTKAKLFIVEGDTGMGKTSAGEIIARRAKEVSAITSIFHIEASAAWADRPNAFLSAVLRALGSPDTNRSQAGRLQKLIETLNERSVVLIIDEAHDMGVRCLRTIKTLLNESPVKIVLLTHPRLFRDLERENWDDVRQLTGNRLLARLNLGSVQDKDVAVIIERRLPSFPSADRARAAADLAKAAQGNGNYAFVREVLIRVKKKSAKHSTVPDLKGMDEATRAELKARKAHTSL